MKAYGNLFDSYFSGKRVLVTGDTGFKGGWLTFMLYLLSAEVHGFGLPPDTQPNLFNLLNIPKLIKHTYLDIRNYEILYKYLKKIKPEIIFHLAAQSLVRKSFWQPIYTLETNILGTANLLKAIYEIYGKEKSNCTIIVITSDKCYENKEDYYSLREIDPLGGNDIYSASKASAEIIVSAWRNVYWQVQNYNKHKILISTARAGNVIGGGDWAEDRIIPDCIRALVKEEPILVRNPLSVRPWQHVLDPLTGYLLLAYKLGTDKEKASILSSPWNFGPFNNSSLNVKELVEKIIKFWGKGKWKLKNENIRIKEASNLTLSIDKTLRCLGWMPILTIDESLQETVDWYKKAWKMNFRKGTMSGYTLSQWDMYINKAKKLNFSWAME